MRYLRDSTLIQQIEQSSSDLINLLSCDYPDIDLHQLGVVAEAVEVKITEYLLEILQENASLLLRMEVSSDHLHLIDRHGSLYQTLASRNLSKPNQLIVCLNKIGGESQRKQEFLIDIDSFGQYSEVAFVYPAAIAPCVNFPVMRHWFKSVVEAGYFWFFDEAGRATNLDLAELAQRLYEYIHKYVVADGLKRNLWFSAIVGGYGFRLINHEVATQSFSIFRSNRKTPAYSSNRYVSELLSTYLPESVMLMRTAIDEGQCVDVNLKDAQYKKEGSIYALTMATLYGCESFTVYPIYKSDRLSVGSVFETEQRQFIEPILDAHKVELAAICQDEVAGVSSQRQSISKAVMKSLELKLGIFGVRIDLKELWAQLGGKRRP